MKAKVIIENGITELVLTPENDFENDIIEKFDKSHSVLSSNTLFSKSHYGAIQQSQINIKLIDKDNV